MIYFVGVIIALILLIPAYNRCARRVRWMTEPQAEYLLALCRQVGCTPGDAVHAVFPGHGGHLTVAEASAVIDHLVRQRGGRRK